MTNNSYRDSRRQFLKTTGSMSLLAAAASVSNPLAAQNNKSVKLRIGYQFGLVYAPILLMKELNLIDEYAPGSDVEFSRVASGAVVRDQMIANQLEVGVLGPPPFLTGWQHLGWKYAVSTGVFPYQLVTWREDIKSLSDFSPEDKIAVPGPNSLQSILLSMGAEKELGDADALKTNIVSLPHPEAATSIMAKNPSVAAHFANVPFLFRELETPGVHAVLDGFDAFGGNFSSPIAFMKPEFAESNPLSVAIFIASYNDAVAILNLEPGRAAEVLAPTLNESPETVEKWLTWPGVTYSSLPYGVMGWHDFMLNAGFINRGPTSLPDVCSTQLLAWMGMEAGEGKNPVERLQERGKG